MILRVGLTGGIASGKSTVAAWFREHDCAVIDADEIVRELYQPGAAGHRALVERYGAAILDAGGHIDRPKLSAAALATPESANELNALIHPLVIDEQGAWFERLDKAGVDRIGIVEATLLLESGGRSRFDRIVVVDVPGELQVARGVARGLPEAEVRLRMSRQMAGDVRVAHADHVIHNGGSQSDLEEQAMHVLEELHRALEEKKRANRAK